RGSSTTAPPLSSGARLDAGGSVPNQAGGFIGGAVFGVYVLGNTGAVTNAGSISSGVRLLGGGSVTNQTGGSITGIVDVFGTGSVTNQSGATMTAGAVFAG